MYSQDTSIYHCCSVLKHLANALKKEKKKERRAIAIEEEDAKVSLLEEDIIVLKFQEKP